MPVLTLARARELVAANNKATDFSNELVLAVCWKESSFDTEAEPGIDGNTSYGLMQMNDVALGTVNANTPAGVHFVHADMADAAKAIAAGTYYLQIILDKFPNADTVADALDQYKGDPQKRYHVNLLAAETCLKSATTDAARQQCLRAIHP